MRSRITILCGFLLFSVIATPAHAGPWSAFVAWLSDLDPKTGGGGIELTAWCKNPLNPTETRQRFACVVPDEQHKLLIKESTAVLAGQFEDGGKKTTVFVWQGLGILEGRLAKNVYVGGGAGFIIVGRTVEGAVPRPLVHARVTFKLFDTPLGLRFEGNLVPKGFPLGTFGAGSAGTGTEFVPGVSFVFLR